MTCQFSNTAVNIPGKPRSEVHSMALQRPYGFCLLCIACAEELRGNLGNQKLCEWLPVPIFPLIMLFWLHFVHNDLLAFQLFKNLCLHSSIFKVWSTTCEGAILLCCQNSTKLDCATWLCLSQQGGVSTVTTSTRSSVAKAECGIRYL